MSEKSNVVHGPIQGRESAGSAGGSHVVVAVASTGWIHEQTLGSIQAMIRTTTRASSVELWWHHASPVGHCRNLLVDRFLEHPGKTHLLFVDTDMAVPQQGLDLLLEAGEPLICGPAPICRANAPDATDDTSPYDLTTNIMDAADATLRGQAVDPVDPSVGCRPRPPAELPDSLFTCDTSGLSFCLIAREVLERMAPPRFYFVDPPDGRSIGEDVYFFRKARQAGFTLAVHPQAWCDHIKPADLTHIEQLVGNSEPKPQWNPTSQNQPPATMVLACTRNHWLHLRSAETLIQWQEEAPFPVGVRLFESPSVAWALARWLHDPASADPSWERLLLLGPDVVATENLINQLSSIDAPIVSTLNRAEIDSQIVYTFTHRDPNTERIDHPVNLALGELTEPIHAHSADLSCSMIHRNTCQHVSAALHHAVDQPTPAYAFDQRFCELVRENTGRDPLVAPLCVERWADVGLLGLLKLKQQVQAERATQLEPACT